MVFGMVQMRASKAGERERERDEVEGERKAMSERVRAISFIVVWCMVYETSKISLEQIDEMYERVDHAWNSNSFQPSWSFQEMRDEGASASGIQLTEHEEARRRTGSSSSETESGTTMTEEDKIIAQLGDVDLSY